MGLALVVGFQVPSFRWYSVLIFEQQTIFRIATQPFQGALFTPAGIASPPAAAASQRRNPTFDGPSGRLG